MASFPAGTTPFFLQFEGARGIFMQEIPCLLDDDADQQHAPSSPFRYSVAATHGCVCGAIIGALLFSEWVKTAPHTSDLGRTTHMHWDAAQ
jgi:hypothetical protein